MSQECSNFNNQVFDLNKFIRAAPVFNGVLWKMLSWIIDSTILGWPLRNYLAKANLLPVKDINIPEEPTYYPFEPYNHREPLTTDVGLQLANQRRFLQKFTLANPHHRSILDYHNMYCNGSLTPEEVVKLLRDKIIESDVVDPPLRCFTQLNWDLALKAGSESTLRYRNNRPLSVLDGIAVGIKDELAVKDFRTNGGRLAEEPINTVDCELVAALRKQGVIIIGITNMHEMGMGVTGINMYHGTPRNPYNDEHVTGGSSSGSAAAVSAGLLAFAIGSDGGGSVRIPSSCCGIHGLKPTYGRYSKVGTACVDSTVTCFGVIATCTADVALVHSLLSDCAPDPKFFSHQSKLPAPCMSMRSYENTKFGTYSEYVSYCDTEILDIFERNIKSRLPNLSEVVIPELYMNKMAHMNILLAETAYGVDIWRRHRSTLSPMTLVMYATCSRSTLHQYMVSSSQKTRAMNMFRQLFQDIDIFVMPTIACLPKKIDPKSLTYGELDEGNLLFSMWFVYLANLCGLPAITVNAGYSLSGLPVGVMLMGSWWREDLLFTAAARLETSLRKPERYYSPVG